MVISRPVIEITVELGERRYPVAIGHGLARMVPDLLSSLRGRMLDPKAQGIGSLP